LTDTINPDTEQPVVPVLSYCITDTEGTMVVVRATRAVTMQPAPGVPGPLALFRDDMSPGAVAIFAAGTWTNCIAAQPLLNDGDAVDS
jgi:hypothetical protein